MAGSPRRNEAPEPTGLRVGVHGTMTGAGTAVVGDEADEVETRGGGGDGVQKTSAAAAMMGAAVLSPTLALLLLNDMRRGCIDANEGRTDTGFGPVLKLNSAQCRGPMSVSYVRSLLECPRTPNFPSYQRPPSCQAVCQATSLSVLTGHNKVSLYRPPLESVPVIKSSHHSRATPILSSSLHRFITSESVGH